MARLSKDRVIEKTQRKLGWPQVCVELLPEHFDEAIDDTDRWFMAWFGSVKEQTVSYASGEREVSVVDDCMIVIDVALPARNTDYMALLNPMAFTDGVAQLPLQSTQIGHGTYSEIEQLLAYQEMGARILGAEREWEYVRQTRKIRMFPAAAPTSSAGTLVYWYTSNEIDYRTMTPWEEHLYLRWMEAECKKTLGRIRSKYGEVPGPAGPVSMDGAELLDEAKTAMEELMIEAKAAPMPFVAG